MNTSTTLWWSDGTPRRFFLLPDDDAIGAGEMQLRGPGGRRRTLAEAALRPYELGEPAALRWAQAQLNVTLDELRDGVDERLDELRAALAQKQREAVAPDTRVTPDAGPALLALLRKLPGVIATSLANDPGRLASAKADMLALQRRLQEAGIDLNERFSGFPDRLAQLRKEFGPRAAGPDGPPDAP